MEKKAAPALYKRNGIESTESTKNIISPHLINKWIAVAVCSGCLLFCLSGCDSNNAGRQPPPPQPSAEPPVFHADTKQDTAADISIEGIVYDQQSPLVIINGQMLSEEDTLAGLRVVEISPSLVSLEDIRTGKRITKEFPEAVADSAQKEHRSLNSGQNTKTSFSLAPAQKIETPQALVYLPARLSPSQKYPLLIVLSPDGNAAAALDYWQEICEKYKWIMLVSKKFRAGIDMRPVIDALAASIPGLGQSCPIDNKKVIVAGFSAGAMGAHFFSWAHPEAVTAIIVNTGMIHETFRDGKRPYPGRKYAVLLASQTDFRYQQMQDDKRFLEQLGWQIKWIEFKGGHTLAPLPVYEEAVQWIKMKVY